MDGQPQAPTANNRFARHPRVTITLVVLVTVLTVDLLLGAFLVPADHHSFRTSHPFFHHGLLPMRNAQTQWGDVTYNMITNSLGFRDRANRQIDLRGPSTRIVVMGDSFVEGMGLDFEHSVVGLLDGAVDSSRMEVLNAGVVSYSPRLYLLKMQYLLETVGLRVSHLVVMVDISDILDEHLYVDFQPALERPWAAAFHQVDGILRQVSLTWSAVSQLSSQRRWHNPAVRADTASWFDTVAERFKGDVNFAYGRAMWTLDKAVYEKWGAHGTQLAVANMERLVELCRKHSVTLTVVVYPWRAQILHGDRDSLQVRIWEEFARQHRVGFINLFPDFVGEEAPDQVVHRYFIHGDDHWNPAGHARVAARLADVLGVPRKPDDKGWSVPGSPPQAPDGGGCFTGAAGAGSTPPRPGCSNPAGQ